LQRLRVVLVALVDGSDVIEDGVGLLQLLQRFGLLDASQAVAQAVEDVPHGALAGQAAVGVALLILHRLQDFPSAQVGVAAGGLDFGVGLGVRLDEDADVGGELGVLDLGAGPGAGGEVLDAADAGSGLVLAGGNGVAVEAEASFGRAGTAVAQSVGDLGLEEATLVALEAARRRADQLLIHVS